MNNETDQVETASEVQDQQNKSISTLIKKLDECGYRLRRLVQDEEASPRRRFYMLIEDGWTR